MNKFFALSKIAVLQFFATKSFGKKKSTKAASLVGIFLLYAFIGILFMFSFGSIYLAMAMSNAETGNSNNVIIILANLLSFVLALCFTIPGFSSHIFKCKDFDFLLSLPIKPSYILHSKVLGIYLVNLYYSLIFLSPAFLIFGIFNGGISLLQGLVMVLNFFLMPCLVMAVSVIFAFFVSLIPDGSPIGKIFSVVLSFSFVGVYFWLNFKVQIFTQLMENPTIIKNVFPFLPTLGFIDKALNGNALYLLVYIGISLLSYFLIFGILSKFYFRIIKSRKGEKSVRKKFSASEIKASKSYVSVFKKECKKYFNSVIYITNTAMGSILLLAFSILSLFSSGIKETLSAFEGQGTGITLLSCIAMLTFCVSMSCTTCSSISLEGKSLWILRSSPIRTRDVFIGKIGLNLCVTAPIAVISVVLMSFSLNLGIANALILFVYAVLICMFSAICGLIINLRLPKLEFTNDAEIIKQSGASSLGMFFPILVMLPFHIAGIIVAVIFGLGQLTAVIMTALVLLLTIISVKVLNSWGSKLYEKL